MSALWGAGGMALGGVKRRHSFELVAIATFIQENQKKMNTSYGLLIESNTIYELDLDKMNLIKNAYLDGVTSDEVKTLLNRYSVTENSVNHLINEKADEIWDRVSSNRIEYENLINVYYERLREEAQQLGKLIKGKNKLSVVRAASLSISGLGLLVFLLLWLFAISIPSYLLYTFFGILIVGILCFMAIFSIDLFIKKAYEKRKSNKQFSGQSKDHLLIAKNKLIKNLNLVVRGYIRETISQVKENDYSLSNNILSYKGLSEVFNQNFGVETKGSKLILKTINKIPGGCIGISGQRGVGKTTLLKSFPELVGSKINNKLILPVFINAPMNYEIREFVIHVFSDTIDKYLNSKGVSLKKSENYESISKNRKDYLGLGSDKFKTKILMITLLLSTIITIYFNQINRNDNDIITLVASSLPIVIGLTFIYWVLSSDRFKTNESIDGLWDYEDTEELSLTEYSIWWRSKLKFQKSYSSGWSGALKVPVGISGSVNSSYSLSQNNLTLPEIITGFKKYVSLVSKDFYPVICIDELDKLENNENAYEFFNGIKSIFGIDQCFFLVSISENALNSFQNRGIPVRDVFDSTFDEVIYLDYLDFETCCKLARRRVVGISYPFLALSFILSGGLPREFIRILRSIVEYNNPNDSNHLERIVTLILLGELRRKARIILNIIKCDNADNEKFIKLLKTLYRISNCNEREFISEELFERLLSDFEKVSSLDQNSVVISNSNIRIEYYFTYFLFLHTVYSLFREFGKYTKKLFDNEFQRTEYLAKCKQLLSTNEVLSRVWINEFRELIKLPKL